MKAALALALALAGAAQAQGLDLLALHERAQASAPLLRGAEAAQAEQQARLAGAGAQLGPQLALVGQHDGGNRAGTRREAQLQLTQSLFDAAGWRERAAQQQRLGARAAEQQLAQQQLRQDSARLYVQWHAQSALLRAQQQLAHAYADEAARMGVRHREGLAAAVDWRQSQSFQWLAEANARGAAQQLRATRHALVAHAGDAALLDAPLQPLRADALPPQPVEEAVQDPKLAALRLERAARDEERAAARRAAWPQLALQAQARRDLRGRDNPHEWQLQLRLPLWDSGLRAAGRDAAQARLTAAEATLQQAEREQQREQSTQAERLLAAREQHATARGALDAAAQTVAAMRVGQEQGSRSTSDVLLALQTEAQLRQLALLAQLEAWEAWIALRAAQGRFDADALHTLNTHLEPR